MKITCQDTPLPAWMVNREYGTKKRTIYPLKIKEILPEQEAVNITKNGQTMKTINVRKNPGISTARID